MFVIFLICLCAPAGLRLSAEYGIMMGESAGVIHSALGGIFLAEENNNLTLGRRTALVVEDNVMNREILCDLLADDYDLLEAGNGLEGLRQLEDHYSEISIILLDVFMPQVDGFEFLRRKQADHRFDSVPVIVMTASEAVDDEIRCLRLGATDFVTKPYNVEVVKNRMRSVIRLRESAAMLNRLEADALTGLASKEFFNLRTEELLRRDPAGDYDLVCCDVERFRALNERYGTTLCDDYLRELAKALPHHLPDPVLAGRIGADVFAFLIRHQEGDWTETLRFDLEPRFDKFNVKYGILPLVDHSLPAATLCDRATLALGTIKGRFQTVAAWYDDKMRKIQLREQQLVESMEESMRNREFHVYYQPKHDLNREKVGGAEALVRWIHPQLGFISPGDFIPLFEKNGFVTQLDFYVWEEVCRQLKRCEELGLPVVPVSVNVSRMDFDIPDLAGRIAALADQYEVDHSLLHIELTESVYGDNPGGIIRTLQELHDDGFIIELDDFGSGYSSLTSLNTLTIDVLKLDMSIIRQASDTNNYSILRYAILLADGMRLKTVAEGVETADQVEALRVLGCDLIQGYYYSKPLPRDDFEAYLAANS